MSNTEQTKKDIDEWTDDGYREERYHLLLELAKDADIFPYFSKVPKLHIKNMDYDKFLITVQGMAKIRELRRIADRG